MHPIFYGLKLKEHFSMMIFWEGAYIKLGRGHPPEDQNIPPSQHHKVMNFAKKNDDTSIPLTPPLCGKTPI